MAFLVVLFSVARADDPRPNVVLVLTDDLSTSDLGYLPSLRALTSERGKTFRMIVPAPRCAPSRASILTGQYPHNHDVVGNSPRNGGWAHLKEREPELLPCWLIGRGYATHYSGKYINGYGHPPGHVPPCWTDWQALTGASAENRYEFAINANGDIERHTGRYQTDVLAEKTVSFVEHTAQPFFAVFAPFAPHAPWVASEQYRGSMRDLEIQRPPSFNESDVSDKWQPSTLLAPATITAIDDRIRARLEMMRSVEDGLAQILSALDARGVARNTYVFFTSDNGYMNGEHRLAKGKGVPYREATEVPLIVSGPGIPPGSTSRQLIVNHDLAPTIATLAGATIPSFVDGRSAVALLSNDHAPWRRRVLLEHWNRSLGLVWRGLRSAGGVQIKWVDGPWESYDHTLDPNELTASAAPGDDDLMERLSACAGRECRRLERRSTHPRSATCRVRVDRLLLGGLHGRACRQVGALLR
jgi:N-acetylglucosamine-6-sulfatase